MVNASRSFVNASEDKHRMLANALGVKLNKSCRHASRNPKARLKPTPAGGSSTSTVTLQVIHEVGTRPVVTVTQRKPRDVQLTHTQIAPER